MSIGEFPDPDKRERQVAEVSNQSMQTLVKRCLRRNPDERPSMADIIPQLTKIEEIDLANVSNGSSTIQYNRVLPPPLFDPQFPSDSSLPRMDYSWYPFVRSRGGE